MSGAMPARLLSARSTVPRETPASSAICRIETPSLYHLPLPGKTHGNNSCEGLPIQSVPEHGHTIIIALVQAIVNISRYYMK
jgi:hypothetical protein